MKTITRALPWLGALTLVAATVSLGIVPATGASPAVPVLATGHVTFPSGVTSGQVLVFASPDQTTEAKDAAGVLDATPLVASTNVGSDGNFTVYTDPASLPASVTGSDGLVNMEAIAVAGGQELPYFFPASPQATPTGVVWVSTSTTGPATANIAFDMGSGLAVNSRYNLATASSRTRIGPKVTVSATKSALSTAPSRLLQIAASAGTTTSTTADAPCGLLPLTPDSIHAEHFLNTSNDGSATMHIAEGMSSSHTLGIAIETSGGGFTSSGNATIERTATTKWTSSERTVSWGYWNKVWYRPYSDTCIHKVVYRPLKFYDVGSADLDGQVLYDYLSASCGDKASGDQWDTAAATAASFSSGIHVAGVGLYVQSGFSNDVNIHFKMLQRGSIRGSNPSGIPYSSKLAAYAFHC